jgi:replicative DNA helicase
LATNPEVLLINHILKTGDIVTPIVSEVEKSLLLYEDEFGFIKEYYTDYKQVPPREVFEDKFTDFPYEKTDGAIEFYIEQTYQYKARNALQQLLTDGAVGLREVGPYKIIQKLTGELAQLGRTTRMVRDLDLVSSSQERLDTFKQRLDIRKSGRKTLGIPTGINKIDESFGGWMKSDFVVVAGWTGSLKSWLSLYMALNAWKSGHKVLYFSLEMSGEQLGYRMDTLLGAGEFSHTALSFGLEDVTYDHYKNWLGTVLHEKHPFVVVSNEDLDEVNQDTVRAKIDQWKPDLVVLDYIALFDEASGVTGETEKTKILSKAFKRIAIKTGVPIICITGVTQDKKDLGETAPELSDLAWSKQLAYDSDLTITLCKTGEMLEVVSKKTRRGKDFRVFLQWDVDKGIVKEIGPRNEWTEDDTSEADKTNVAGE